MTGTTASSITAISAHREWATRPPDERYASVHALYEATCARRLGTVERRTETVALRTVSVTDDVLTLRDHTGRTAPLTHWSFDQLATIAGTRPTYLRSAPASIASAAINQGLSRLHRAPHDLLVDRAAPGTVRAITSPSYTRVHHDELVSRVLDLMASHSAWHLPLGYQDGVWGAPRVPSGAYLGNRDLFLFLVDGNRGLNDPTDRSGSGLFRGFILRNSDVGAAALTLDTFLFRVVCANHIIWGFEHMAGVQRSYEGATIQEAWPDVLACVQQALDADTGADRAMVQRAATKELAATRADVIQAATTRFELPRKLAADAYDMAEAFEGNPRSVWGYVQGLTRLSQGTAWQDSRFALDRAASRLLTTVNTGGIRQRLVRHRAA